MLVDKLYIWFFRIFGVIKIGVLVMVFCSWFFGFDIFMFVIFVVLFLIFLSKNSRCGYVKVKKLIIRYYYWNVCFYGIGSFGGLDVWFIS